MSAWQISIKPSPFDYKTILLLCHRKCAVSRAL
jgi:hypothetical protein